MTSVALAPAGHSAAINSNANPIRNGIEPIRFWNILGTYFLRSGNGVGGWSAVLEPVDEATETGMRLGQTMLFVRDLERMITFYRDVMGLRPVEATRSGDWIEFDTGGAPFALHAIP